VQYLLESAVGNPSTAHAFDGSRHWDRCQFVCMQVVQACVFARAPRSKAVLWRMKTPNIKEKSRHYAGASCVFYSTPTLMRTLCNAYICAAYHVRINKCLQQPNHSGNDRVVSTSRIVQYCLNRATHCEHLALESQHPDMQFIYRDLAQQWRDIARQVKQLENDQSERPKSN
jgi:hypothetical protein